MKKHISTILLILVFFTGLSVLLYPAVSDYWNSRVQSRAIATYNKTVSDMTETEYEALLKDAEEYNRRLYETKGSFYDPTLVEGYYETLDISGTGIMGYLSIDRIKVELPVYHGTGEGILQVAAGHLEGSSFPVGGGSTHCVLSAHRGLPSASLFTHLDKMEEGDTFTITVLNRMLTYEVDQILIVEPEDVDALQIVEGEDYCTLLTCTPYGINTHRLLVRGKRIETIDKPKIYISPEAYKIDPIIVTPVVAVPVLFVLLMILLVKYRKKKK